MSTLSEIIGDQQHRISALEEQNRLLREALESIAEMSEDSMYGGDQARRIIRDRTRAVLATKPTT